MAEEGYGQAGWARYEDYQSLKRFIHSEKNILYSGDYCWEIQKLGRQTTTGSDAEFQMTDSITITEPSKTEVEIELYSDGDHEDSAGIIATLVYKSNDGLTHTATATATTTTNGTPIDFVGSVTGTKVTDFYCPVSMSISEADANQILYAADPSQVVYCTVAQGQTEARDTLANQELEGTGNLYVRFHTDNAAGDGAIVNIDYITPWGEVVKDCVGTITDAASTYRVLQSDDTPVKDCWRIISLISDTAPTGDTHELYVVNDLAGTLDNVDGSGLDVPAVITEASVTGYDLRFSAPESAVADVWLGSLKAHSLFGAAGDAIELKIHLTPYGNTTEKTLVAQYSGVAAHDFCIKLQPDTDCWCEVNDIGNARKTTVLLTYIWATKKATSDSWS